MVDIVGRYVSWSECGILSSLALITLGVTMIYFIKKGESDERIKYLLEFQKCQYQSGINLAFMAGGGDKAFCGLFGEKNCKKVAAVEGEINYLE